ERQMEASLRASHADVEKTSLLVDVAVCDRLAMRQQAFLEPDQEHMRKFEAFCRVQRRQADGIRLAAILPVQHRDQRDHLRELEQVPAVLLALLPQPVEKVAHTAPASFRLLALAGQKKVVLVADADNELVEEPCRGLAFGPIAPVVDELAKGIQSLALA